MNRVSEATLFGSQVPVIIEENPNLTKPTASFQDSCIYVTMNTYDHLLLNQVLKRFFTRLLKEYVDSIVSQYTKQLKLRPRSVTIETSFNKWGSCNSSREIRLNWKLSLLSKDLVEYVIVHELCHMLHLNHDRSFWRLVGKLYPDYKIAESKLDK